MLTLKFSAIYIIKEKNHPAFLSSDCALVVIKDNFKQMVFNMQDDAGMLKE